MLVKCEAVSNNVISRIFGDYSSTWLSYWKLPLKASRKTRQVLINHAQESHALIVPASRELHFPVNTTQPNPMFSVVLTVYNNDNNT